MKALEIDQLLFFVKGEFSKLKSQGAKNQQCTLADVLQSRLAIFSLKDISLLEFHKRYTQRSTNLQ